MPIDVCRVKWSTLREKLKKKPVEHVCILAKKHPGVKHRCACGATK